MNETRSVGAALGLVALALLACGRKDESTTTTTTSAAAATETTAEPEDTTESTATASAAPTASAAGTAAAPKYISCPPGQAAVGTKGECVRVCTDSAPCPDSAESCEKTSFVSVNGQVRNVRACMAGGGGPGFRKMVPGAPWLNDQVPKDMATAAPSAAPTATAAAGNVSDFVKPDNQGDCPKGFTMNGGMTCSRVCKSKADCHGNNTCVSLPVGTTKVCDEPGNAP